MDDSERDKVLRDIQKDSAVTRHRVEQLCDDVTNIKDTQDDHDKRISENNHRSSNNRRILASITAGVGALAVATYEFIITVI